MEGELRWPFRERKQWVMVCIEHFRKWVQLIPLLSKSSKDSARGFMVGVLSRYNAAREVLTDQGHEFMSIWGSFNIYVMGSTRVCVSLCGSFTLSRGTLHEKQCL